MCFACSGAANGSVSFWLGWNSSCSVQWTSGAVGWSWKLGTVSQTVFCVYLVWGQGQGRDRQHATSSWGSGSRGIHCDWWLVPCRCGDRVGQKRALSAPRSPDVVVLCPGCLPLRGAWTATATLPCISYVISPRVFFSLKVFPKSIRCRQREEVCKPAYN